MFNPAFSKWGFGAPGAGFTPWGFGAPGGVFNPWGFGPPPSFFTPGGEGLPDSYFTPALFGGSPPTVGLHGGGTFMNASGMGTGFYVTQSFESPTPLSIPPAAAGVV